MESGFLLNLSMYMLLQESLFVWFTHDLHAVFYTELSFEKVSSFEHQGLHSYHLI